MLAWFLHRHIESKTDLGTVIRYAMVHDLLEIEAGDPNAYASDDERAEKERRERKALETFSVNFASFPDLVECVRAYLDEKKNAEALFVWTVDKLQHVILGQMDAWRPYRTYGITKERFAEKMEEYRIHAHPELQPIVAEITAWAQETF